MYANKVDKTPKEDDSPNNKVNTEGNWTVKSFNAPTEIAHNDSEVNLGEE